VRAGDRVALDRPRRPPRADGGRAPAGRRARVVTSPAATRRSSPLCRTAAPNARDALFACIAALIDGRHGGGIAERYLFELAVARRNGP
jgi:hypothetical protein